MLNDLVTLWRPVGPRELELIAEAGMAAFPPRLRDQPIFYPLLTEAYATKIARDWNAPRGGGFVTRFQMRRDFISRYQVQEAGGREHQEYWVPAEELPAFNAAIVGRIEVVAAFASPGQGPVDVREESGLARWVIETLVARITDDNRHEPIDMGKPAGQEA